MDFLQKLDLSGSGVGTIFVLVMGCIIGAIFKNGFATSLFIALKDARHNKIKDRRQRFEYCRALLEDENAPVSPALRAEMRRECERLAFEETTGIRTDYEKIGPFLKLISDGKIRRKTLEKAFVELQPVDGELRYQPIRIQNWRYYFAVIYIWFAFAFTVFLIGSFGVMSHISKQYEWSFLLEAAIVYGCFLCFRLMTSSERCARKVEREMQKREKEKEAAAAN